MPQPPDPTPAVPARPLRWAGRRGASRCGWVGALAGLAGCAGTPPPGAATADAPGPTARLLLRGAVPPDQRYAVLVMADALDCKGPKLLVGGTPQKAPDPAQLPAGALTTLDFVVLRAGQPGCLVRWSFTPAAGKTYLVQGMVVGAGCTARLFDASTPDKPTVPPDLRLRSVPGQACVPLALSRAASGEGSLIEGGQHNGEAVLMPNATARDLQWLIAP